MPEPRTRTNEEVFELLTLGLSWVQHISRSKRMGWAGHGILKTICACSTVLSKKQYLELTASPSKALRDDLFQHAHLLDAPAGDPQYAPTNNAKLHEWMSTVDKPLVVVVNTMIYFGDKLTVPKGYKLFVTPVGQQFAQALVEKYKPELTFGMFRPQWDKHCNQMRAMRGRLSDQI